MKSEQYRTLTDTDGKQYRFSTAAFKEAIRNKANAEKEAGGKGFQISIKKAMCNEEVSLESIKNWTSGYNGPRSMDVVKHCADVLEIDYHELLTPLKKETLQGQKTDLPLQEGECVMFYWNTDIEDVLARLSESYNTILEGTDFYTKRDDTPGEKCVELYRKGNPRRIGHFWPKVRNTRKSAKETIDFCVYIDLFQYLRAVMDLPEDSDIKSGRYSNWRGFNGITYEKSVEMMKMIAQKN